MSPELRRLMKQCNTTLNSIENTISKRIDLSENDTKDEIIARQTIIIKDSEKQLAEITKKCIMNNKKFLSTYFSISILLHK